MDQKYPKTLRALLCFKWNSCYFQLKVHFHKKKFELNLVQKSGRTNSTLVQKHKSHYNFTSLQQCKNTSNKLHFNNTIQQLWNTTASYIYLGTPISKSSTNIWNQFHNLPNNLGTGFQFFRIFSPSIVYALILFNEKLGLA